MKKLLIASAAVALLFTAGVANAQSNATPNEGAATLALMACGDDFRPSGYPSKGDCLMDVVTRHSGTEAAKLADKTVRAMLSKAASTAANPAMAPNSVRKENKRRR